MDVPLNFMVLDAAIVDDNLQLEKMQVYLQGMEIDLAGQVIDYGEKGGTLDVQFDLPLTKISKAINGMPSLSGQAKLTARLEGDFSDPTLSGTLEIRNGSIDWVRTEDADLKFTVDRRGARFDGSLLHFAEGSIAVKKARLLFKDQYPLETELQLANVELAKVLDNVTPLHSKTIQRQSGMVKMSGTLQPLLLDGSADLEVLNHSTHSVGHRLHQVENEITNLPKSHVRVGLHADSSAFEIRKGTATFGRSVVDVGVVRFDFDSSMHMEYSSDNLYLEEVGPIVGLALSGHGSVSCTIDVSKANETTIEGWVDIGDFQVNEYRFGDMKSNLFFRNNLLSFQDIDVRKNRSSYHSKVSFEFGKGSPLMSFDLSTDPLYVSDLIEILGKERSLKGEFLGRMVGNGSLAGRPGDWKGEGRFVLPTFSTSLQHFDSALVELKIENSDLSFNRLEARIGNALLSATGSIKKLNEFDIRVSSSGLKIRDLDLTSSVTDEAEGDAEISGRVSGTMDEPLVTARMNWDEMRMKTVSYPPSEMHLELTENYLDLQGKFWDRQVKYSLLFQFHPLNVLDMHVRLDDFRYEDVLGKLLDLQVSRGAVTAEIRSKVPLRTPRLANGVADISSLKGSLKGIALGMQGQGRVSLAEGVFRLEPLRLKGKHVEFELRGDVDYAGEMNAIFKGTTDWRQVALLSEEILDARGKLDFDLSLGGRWQQLGILGSLNSQDARVFIKALESPIERLNGVVQVDVNQVHFDGISFAYNGGEVGLSGSAAMAFPDFSFDEVNVRMDLNRVGFKLDEGMTPLLSGQLTMNGSPWPLALGGNLVVDELVYTRVINWRKSMIAEKISEIIKPKKYRLTGEQTPKLTFDVDISAPATIRVRNNMADLILTADLKLTGDNLSPGLLNTISADRELMFFEENEFEVVRFMVEFTKPDRIYPRFDIYGETEVTYIDEEVEKTVTISLDINGDMDDLKVELGSDSGMSQTDIVYLLIVGQPAAYVDKYGGGSQVATGIGLNALSSLVGVNERIQSQFKLDEFRLTTGYAMGGESRGSNVNIVPRLVIGKEIANDIYITYSTSIGEQEMQQDQSFQIRYRLEHFTISGQWDADSEQQYGNFGADLKFHIDF